MGQRLNLEIVKTITKPDEVLANAYYHWSGYTRSANKLTNLILREIQNVDSEIMKITDNQLRAIRLLELTDALLTENELKHIAATHKDETFELANSRNDGLIAVTERGIKETRVWEEGRITIYLDELLINANCHWKKDSLEEYQEYMEDEEFDLFKEKLVKLNLNVSDLSALTVNEFKEFYNMCDKASESEVYAFIVNNDINNIVDIIE